MLNCRLFEVLAVFITSPLGLEKCLLELGVTNKILTELKIDSVLTFCGSYMVQNEPQPQITGAYQ
jgi:hypothetical protein